MLSVRSGDENVITLNVGVLLLFGVWMVCIRCNVNDVTVGDCF